MTAAAALRAWRTAVGESHVVADGEELGSFSSATHVGSHEPVAVVRPGSRDEVRECIHIARRHGVPVHPVGGGTNWGYGSAGPPAPGCVVLDLRRMDRIAVDRELATATVEPGVTFRQLAEHLREHAPELVASVTAASGRGSVIGHAMERGIGSGPLGDRSAHLIDLEVVTGTGEVLETGAGRFGARSPYRTPAGIDLTSLFAQSGLAVVTRATTLLQVRPAASSVLRVEADSPEAWSEAVDAVRALALEGVVTTPVAWWNDVRRMANSARYPWRAAADVTPLPAAVREAARQQLSIGRWGGTVVLHGPSADRLAADEVLARDRLERPGLTVSAIDDPGQLRDTTFDGWPDERNLRGAYWRKRQPVPPEPDPARDGCGVLWLDCAFPHLGSAALAADRVVEATAPEFGFEPVMIAVNPTPRTLVVVPMVVCDLDVPGEGRRAADCAVALHRALVAAGGVVTRANPAVMPDLPRSIDSFDDVVRRIGDVLDPDRVVSPGRYDRS